MEVLKVYYLCLLFGFQGRYRVRGGEIELASIVEDAGGVLARSGMIGDATLAPNAARPQENLGGVRSHMPLIYISLVAVLLSLGGYFVMKLVVGSQADDLIEHIENTSSVAADPSS